MVRWHGLRAAKGISHGLDEKYGDDKMRGMATTRGSNLGNGNMLPIDWGSKPWKKKAWDIWFFTDCIMKTPWDVYILWDFTGKWYRYSIIEYRYVLYDLYSVRCLYSIILYDFIGTCERCEWCYVDHGRTCFGPPTGNKKQTLFWVGHLGFPW